MVSLLLVLPPSPFCMCFSLYACPFRDCTCIVPPNYVVVLMKRSALLLYCQAIHVKNGEGRSCGSIPCRLCRRCELSPSSEDTQLGWFEFPNSSLVFCCRCGCAGASWREHCLTLLVALPSPSSWSRFHAVVLTVGRQQCGVCDHVNHCIQVVCVKS